MGYFKGYFEGAKTFLTPKLSRAQPGWWYAAGKNIRFSYQNVLFCARTFCTVHKQNVLFCTLSSKKTIFLIFKVPKLSFISSKPIHSHVTFQGLSHDAKIYQIGQIKWSIICRT
jgi:hypothetical protein